MNKKKQTSTPLTLTINFDDTVENINTSIDELLNRFQEINTKDIGIQWDEAEWIDESVK